MIIDCVSDLHGYYPELEGGDLLIVAGDLTVSDTLYQHLYFLEWLAQQPYKKKIFIAGNHDNFLIGTKYIPIKDVGIEYLCDSGTEFEGFKIWGSPRSLWFQGINPHCTAFTGSEEDLKKKFDLIPDGIDILITHSPPYGILDECRSGHVGSKSLRDAIDNVMPDLVLFGHIHEQGGKYVQKEGILYVNGSIVDERYRNVNRERRIVFDEKMPKMQRFKVIE